MVYGILLWVDEYWRCSNISVVWSKIFMQIYCCSRILFVTVDYLHFPKIRSKRILLLNWKYWISKNQFRTIEIWILPLQPTDFFFVCFQIQYSNVIRSAKLILQTQTKNRNKIKASMESILARVTTFLLFAFPMTSSSS